MRSTSEDSATSHACRNLRRTGLCLCLLLIAAHYEVASADEAKPKLRDKDGAGTTGSVVLKTTLPVKLVIIGKKQKNHGAGLGKEIPGDSALKGLTLCARERLVFPSVGNQSYRS